MIDRACVRCGHVGWPKTVVPGYLLVEIALWLSGFAFALLWLGALAYSLWRHMGQHKACGKCGSTELVPTDSPKLTAAQVVAAPAAPVRDEVPCPRCAEPILRAALVCKHCHHEIKPVLRGPDGQEIPLSPAALQALKGTPDQP